jgi:hypothetical protein
VETCLEQHWEPSGSIEEVTIMWPRMGLLGPMNVALTIVALASVCQAEVPSIDVDLRANWHMPPFEVELM